MFSRIKQDIQAVKDRDPAARSTLEVLLCYPGLHALFGCPLFLLPWADPVAAAYLPPLPLFHRD